MGEGEAEGEPEEEHCRLKENRRTREGNDVDVAARSPTPSFSIKNTLTASCRRLLPYFGRAEAAGNRQKQGTATAALSYVGIALPFPSHLRSFHLSPRYASTPPSSFVRQRRGSLLSSDTLAAQRCLRRCQLRCGFLLHLSAMFRLFIDYSSQIFPIPPS
jgi:hypothetical protein